MKIGVWLTPDYSPEVGGGYSYYNRLIQGLDTYQFDNSIELCFITEKKGSIKLFHPVIELHYEPKLTFEERFLKRIPLLREKTRRQIEARLTRERGQIYSKCLNDAGVKLVYYPQQAQCELPDFPFVATNWDIGHRSTWTFPEVVSKGEFEARENIYNQLLPKALMVICESDAGKEELVRNTHINPNRIRVARLFAGEASSIEVSSERQNEILKSLHLIKNKFFYYPAQFWAHKNHYTLLQAFAYLLKIHPECRLVFSGSDKGTLSHIRSVCDEMGLGEKVLFAGFVPVETVATLYKNAVALVMPTLMGPTNMPLLEAMELGCPVICSDFPGHREELSDAAIYVNPLDAKDICRAMEELLSQRDIFSKRILERITDCPFTLELALEALNNHFLEAIHLRNCWGE